MLVGSRNYLGVQNSACVPWDMFVINGRNLSVSQKCVDTLG